MQLRTFMGLAFGILTSIGPLTAVAAGTDVSRCPVNKQWQDAYNKGNANAVLALYTPNAIEVTPEGIRVGAAAIKDRIEGAMKQLKDAVIVATKCDVGTTFRWSSGTWKAASSQGSVGGFWTAIESKDGDAWKIENLTYNTTPPPANK